MFSRGGGLRTAMDMQVETHSGLQCTCGMEHHTHPEPLIEVMVSVRERARMWRVVVCVRVYDEEVGCLEL